MKPAGTSAKMLFGFLGPNCEKKILAEKFDFSMQLICPNSTDKYYYLFSRCRINTHYYFFHHLDKVNFPE